MLVFKFLAFIALIPAVILISVVMSFLLLVGIIGGILKYAFEEIYYKMYPEQFKYKNELRKLDL